MHARIPLEVIRDPSAMRARAERVWRSGRRICVVPTMGYLHDGHLSLLRAGRARADVLILTIFVNPTQFGASEDLDAYPRDEASDLDKARACGVDIAFCPDVRAMYPAGYQTYIDVQALQQPLCGAGRPGHFRGVATVVTKLFHITRPHLAIFGQKDFQQLAVIRQMVRDLDFGIDIVGMPIVREPDGLAMSSRNAYLSPLERERALCLSRGLAAARERFLAGERTSTVILQAARAPIEALEREAPGDVRIEYVDLRDATTLEDVAAPPGDAAGPAADEATIERSVVLAMAVFVGKTRLIDNAVFTP